MFLKVLDTDMKVLNTCVGEDHAKKVAKGEKAAITVEEEKQM